MAGELFGDALTETDIRLFVTLVRFDTAYHGLFKCNRNTLAAMLALHAYLHRILALFGSMARDEVGETSDIDFLVTFDGPATADRFFGLQFYLEDLLGRPVDLVTDKALRPELRPYIEREAMHV